MYLSILPVNIDCQSGVIVIRSTNGGQTFGSPFLAHYSDTCAYSDDKNWLVVDNWRTSPHYGRLYQFWTPFIADDLGNFVGAPQAVRWSDDHGQTWSGTTYVTPTDIDTQNSQPMIQPNGAITDAYLNFGHDATGQEGPEANVGHHSDSALRAGAAPDAPTAVPAGDNWAARTSYDGGATWSSEVLITNDAGEGPAGIRCCLPSATADPVTGRLYTAWDSATPDHVKLSRSLDGRHWSRPLLVSRSDRPGLDRVNVDVSAYRGQVFVSYGTRDTSVGNGRYVQQQLSRRATARTSAHRSTSVHRPTWTMPHRQEAFSRVTMPAARRRTGGSTSCGAAHPHGQTRPRNTTRRCGRQCSVPDSSPVSAASRKR